MTKVTTQMDAWTENELLGDGWHRMPQVEATWHDGDPLAIKLSFGAGDDRIPSVDWYMAFDLFHRGALGQVAGTGDVRFSTVGGRQDLIALTLIGWIKGASDPDVCTVLLGREHMRRFCSMVQDSRAVAGADVVAEALEAAIAAILESSDPQH